MLMAKGQESQPLLTSHLLSLAKVSHMAEARVSGQGRKPCSEGQRAWTQGEVRNQGINATSVPWVCRYGSGTEHAPPSSFLLLNPQYFA